MVGLYLTVDVEEPPHNPGRAFAALIPLVEELERSNIKATFFVVGERILEWKSGLQRLVAGNHEIGIHGWRHVPLNALSQRELHDDLCRARASLAEATGVAPVGFRAPFFSLTSQTPWAPDIILDAGFEYSSSVLPAFNPQAGFPGAPKTSFRWKNGLLEIPVPLFGFGKYSIPVTGGAYIRLLPKVLVSIATKRFSFSHGHWAYAHPYDFDTEERFQRWEEMPWIASKLLFARRHLMLERVMSLASPQIGTLSHYAAQGLELRTFDPWVRDE